MKRLLAFGLSLLLAFGAANGILAQEHDKFEVGQGTFLLNGKPFVIKAAEVHYPRIPEPYWEHRIEMCKALGMNTLCLYVFWNLHEPSPGQFDFSGNNDIARFCRLRRSTGCTSSCVRDPTSVPNGKWADCPGGC